MKKELLKVFTMLTLIVTLALATAVVSANGQSTAKKVVASVPFEFSVGYKTMPAGEYSVQAIASAGDGLLIQSTDGKISALRLADATERIKDKSQAHLVFHRYGERYFLAEVWNGTDNTGRQLKTSQEESAIASELASASENAHAPNATYEIVEVLAVLR
ncbi:MAG: hypothetical protein ACREA9_29645 [Pyrinomonadaceae bacterium]